MEFRFIDNSVPLDRQSQRLIRSHAMKGKNLGRIVPNRGRKKRQHQDIIQAPQQTKVDEGAADPKDVPSPINPFSGAEFSYFELPASPTPSMRYLFTQFHYAVCEDLCPPLFCRLSNDAVATSWFEHIIADPSAFHCGIAMMAAHVSLFRDHRDDTREALRHFSQALRLLRRDLSEATTPRIPSLLVVISLAMHANVTGSLGESRVHLDGLQRMLELRPGGLAALRVHRRELANKIRRADVELALLAGEQTCFGTQGEPAPVARSVAPAAFGTGRGNLPYPLEQMFAPLQDVVRDILALCRCAGRAQFDGYQYQDVIISIMQRLVDCAPLKAPRPPRPVDDVCQLGLVAFMMTIMYRNGRMRATYSALLAKLLRVRLGTYDEEPSVRVDSYPSLRLWLVFFYAFSTLEGEQRHDERAFVAWHVRTRAAALGVTTWEDARAHLSRFPWIAAMHDSPGKNLWESAHHP